MKSMTGMGRASGLVLGVQVTLEIKTLNHRYCDIHLRAPFKYQMLEHDIQQVLKSKIARGKIDVIISESLQANTALYSTQAIETAVATVKALQAHVPDAVTFSLSDVLQVLPQCAPQKADTKEIWLEFQGLLNEALQDLTESRAREGLGLKRVLSERFHTLRSFLGDLKEYSQNLRQQQEEKLRKRISEKLAGDLDESRLLTEVVFYLDKLDINEELDRLASHFKLAEELLASPEAMGRKFDFLLQEFNREFNTIGSKSQEANVAHIIVNAKTELEKIREQIQNIE